VRCLRRRTFPLCFARAQIGPFFLSHKLELFSFQQRAFTFPGRDSAQASVPNMRQSLSPFLDGSPFLFLEDNPPFFLSSCRGFRFSNANLSHPPKFHEAVNSLLNPVCSSLPLYRLTFFPPFSETIKNPTFFSSPCLLTMVFSC